MRFIDAGVTVVRLQHFKQPAVQQEMRLRRVAQHV